MDERKKRENNVIISGLRESPETDNILLVKKLAGDLGNLEGFYNIVS
jgi:hypothetical protein